jgi:hypothetical protein
VEGYGTARQHTADNIIWRMHAECCITKATNTHPEYVILTAFPRQQWLHQCAPMFCYTCIAWFVLHRLCGNVCAVSEFLILGL